MKKNTNSTKSFALMLLFAIICSQILGCGASSSDILLVNEANPIQNIDNTVEATAPDIAPEVSINTIDIYGNPYTDDLYKDAKVIMLNYWEPWCGPCVSEMPDLQKLYEAYKDKGFLILGIYTTFEMDAEAKDFIESNGITYPILKCSDELYELSQNYVPATYFIDGNGNFYTSDPFAGAKSYDEWEKILKEYLGE